MNVIIPVGGKGERFINAGYIDPKPLINVFNKQMICYVIDNIHIDDNDIYIIYKDFAGHDFESIMKAKYPNINMIKIDKQTNGASETILLGLDKILHIAKYKKCMLFDCDTFYTQDVVSMYSTMSDNAVFYRNNTSPNAIYSYIIMNNDGVITDIKEKQKISDYANTGIYCFNDINELHYYSKKVVDNSITFNNEYYTSCIIDTMINDGKKFRGIELNNIDVTSLGTPAELNTYIEKSHIFLFDLDGTLVMTDNIYFEVWKDILIKYNIHLTHDIFDKYIKGNSDDVVLKKLNLNTISIDELSVMKDKNFVENVDKINIIDGAIEFLEDVYRHGHKIAIVTNCNRHVAESILQITKMKKYVEFIICGNECKNPKPHPEPYLKAIEKFNGSKAKTIIFEDSKTGILSGKSAMPKCLCGIETSYTRDELYNHGVNISAKNYTLLNINDLIQFNDTNLETIKKNIIESVDFEIKNIKIHNEKLKGGFISDVLSLEIETKKEIINCVLKLESKKDTALSRMANKLGLYDREYYFYQELSKYIPISFPKCYGIIKDEHFNNIGILMENMFMRDYKINLDLGIENIDTSLRIINSIAQMHAKFWNKDLQKNFKDLKKHNDKLFNPEWKNYVAIKWPIFEQKWKYILTEKELKSGEQIVKDFQYIQDYLSSDNLTLCHGDVKSANTFYKLIHDDIYDPCFIDWQYVCIGKGVQDIVFFLIESFSIEKITEYKNLFFEYYYVQLIRYGIKNYSKTMYEKDIEYSIKYYPFFVAVWFGTTNDDELIDKNFPFFFIKKLFYLLSN